MDELTGLASQQLERIKVLAAQSGFNYVELPPFTMGVGIAIGFTETSYVVLSIMGAGSEDQLLITSGLLHGINEDRLAALTAANYFTSQNPTCPVFLQDAEAGWALLLQVRQPIDLFLDVPQYFSMVVRSMPVVTDEYRGIIAERWSLGGRAWEWTAEDHNELLIRSMI